MALSIKKENYNIFPRNLKNKFPFDFEVFPPDERVKVADEKLRPYCWVCKIQVRYIDPTTKTGGWSEGTGILIRSNYVLTNAHVILGKGKPSTHTVLDKIVVTIGLNNTNKIAGLFETKTFRIHPNFGTERANPPLDFDSPKYYLHYQSLREGWLFPFQN